MEPAVYTFPIEETIKFKKSDLEPLRNSRSFYTSSRKIFVCKIYGVIYYISIYPNGSCKDDRGMVFIFITVSKGYVEENDVDIDIKYLIESAKYLINAKKTFNDSESFGKFICKTEEFFDSKNNFFVDDYMTVKVSGCFKIVPLPGIRHLKSVKWPIQEADLEAIRTTRDSRLKSKKFPIAEEGFSVFLEMYPNGRNEEERGKVVVIIHFNNDTGESSEYIFNLFIGPNHFSILKRFSSSKYWGHGGYICSTENLFNHENQYLLNGVLAISFTSALYIRSKNERQPAIPCIKKIEIQPKNETFEFIVEANVLTVYKHVFVEASPVLAAMFQAGMKEQIEGKVIIIHFSCAIVNAAKQMLYGEQMDPMLTYDQMKTLLQFSDEYDIKLIKEHVQDYLIQYLSPTNVCDLIVFSSAVSAPSGLRTKCIEYFTKCMKESKLVYGLEMLDPIEFCEHLKSAFVLIVETDS